jgi:hypothetical protein
MLESLGTTFQHVFGLYEGVVGSVSVQFVPSQLSMLHYEDLLWQPTTYLSAVALLVQCVCVVRNRLTKAPLETNRFQHVLSISSILVTGAYYASAGKSNGISCTLQLLLPVFSVSIVNMLGVLF